MYGRAAHLDTDTTWGGEYINGVKNTIPGLETTGDSMWIQPGQRILLDCDIKVYMLIVQGNLEFDDWMRQSAALQPETLSAAP